MSDNIDSDKIELFLSDDQKIKAVGEILTNNSSRTILQLLFEEELTANEISVKTEISLQLVKYHLNKMQQVGMVKISKVGKNIKSHDMKYYKATKFAIVILPSKVSDRAKESKSLIRSFKTIYKFAGVGVAAVAGLFSLSFLQEQTSVPASDSEYPKDTSNPESMPASSTVQPQEEGGAYLGRMEDQVETGQNTLEEALEIQRRRIESTDANPASGSGTPLTDGGDMLITIIIIAVVLGGLAAYFFFRARRYSKLHKIKE